MDLQSLYLDIGDKLFEVGCCEEALIYYQRAYEEESGQQEILARVSEQYILQEEANFKRYLSIRQHMGYLYFKIFQSSRSS